MSLDRRTLLGHGARLGVAAFLGVAGRAVADAGALERALAGLADGAFPLEDERLALVAPAVAENGDGVPISFTVESPMTAEDHVETVVVVAPANPEPEIARFRFTPASGVASAAVRIRLAETQDLVAVARTSAGALYRTSRRVEVIVAGCAG